ncbi:helix-turn-helix domain-containing protein [Escherichia coli]|uniref:helix-turn-helix domain-containing protein n=1 Tax=Escherichia coli TaxID=562 RepID=UPI00111492FD|nr:helix-turn-helix domain-containing protein [Escherichia coli]
MNKTKGCLIANFATVPMKILLADPEMTVGAVAKRFNVSRMTIYRYTTKGNHSEKINDE